MPTPAVQVGQGGRRRSGSSHAGPGIKFGGHIGCIHTWQDFIYLDIVIDSRSKTIAGWAIENHMRVELAEHAWRHALDTTQIEDDGIFRSDCGSPCTGLRLGSLPPATQNHCNSGVWALWKAAPAVNEVWWWQAVHFPVLRGAKGQIADQ